MAASSSSPPAQQLFNRRATRSPRSPRGAAFRLSTELTPTTPAQHDKKCSPIIDRKAFFTSLGSGSSSTSTSTFPSSASLPETVFREHARKCEEAVEELGDAQQRYFGSVRALDYLQKYEIAKT